MMVVGERLLMRLGIREGVPKRRKVDGRVNIDLASLPGLPNFLQGTRMQVCGGGISGADFAAWLCSVDTLCKFTSFLKSLHWLVDTRDMGHFGPVYPLYGRGAHVQASTFWVGNSVLMVLLLGHWIAVSVLVFGHFVGCLCFLRVQQRSFWMAH